MQISHSIKGISKLKKAFASFEKEALKSQVAAVQDSVFLIHANAVELLQSNTDGEKQTRYNPKREVSASYPGDPPNTDTGRAVQSIKFEFENGGLTGRVGTNLRYLAGLEFGMKNIKPRPWLSVAVKMASKEVAQIFKKAIAGVVNDVGT